MFSTSPTSFGEPPAENAWRGSDGTVNSSGTLTVPPPPDSVTPSTYIYKRYVHPGVRLHLDNVSVCTARFRRRTPSMEQSPSITATDPFAFSISLEVGEVPIGNGATCFRTNIAHTFASRSVAYSKVRPSALNSAPLLRPPAPYGPYTIRTLNHRVMSGALMVPSLLMSLSLSTYTKVR